MQDTHPMLSKASKDSMESLIHIRIAVCGSQNVGKSEVIKKITQTKHKSFDTKPYTTADEIKSRNKIVNGNVVLEFVEGVNVRVDAFILLFSVDDEASFNNIELLKDELIASRGTNLPIIVVGNKTDIANREVRYAMTDCIVSVDWELQYLEVSAKTGTDINSILPSLLRHDFFKNSRFKFQLRAPRRCKNIFARNGFKSRKENSTQVIHSSSPNSIQKSFHLRRSTSNLHTNRSSSKRRLSLTGLLTKCHDSPEKDSNNEEYGSNNSVSAIPPRQRSSSSGSCSRTRRSSVAFGYEKEDELNMIGEDSVFPETDHSHFRSASFGKSSFRRTQSRMRSRRYSYSIGQTTPEVVYKRSSREGSWLHAFVRFFHK